MIEFEAVMGLEIHMKLKTQSKMFCSCRNEVFELDPNTSICPVCMGHPGTLPVVNHEAVIFGSLLGLALNAQVREYSKFDRKNYFYPDLPKGYQISQYDEPLCENGVVSYLINGEKRNCTIIRIHLEEDAGKLGHESGKTFVDFNRAGTPLAEIVTAPDFRTKEEVTSFLRELQQIARYLGISRGDMEKGELRCDVNISLREKGATAFGTKVEIKNMNSFSAIEKAIQYEIQRQSEMLNENEKIKQETRGWSDDKQITLSQRSKEEAMDYRYFPEPDLPPLILESEMIQGLSRSIPELPSKKRERYAREWGVKEDDAKILAADVTLARFFEESVALFHEPLKISNILLSIVLFHIRENNIESLYDTNIKPQHIAKSVEYIQKGELSMTALKTVIETLYQEGGEVDEIVERKSLRQVSDTSALEKICVEVLQENEAMVGEYKAGKTKVFGNFVGQAMKKSAGKANPALLSEILQKLLQ